jgi:hypothetical protein
LKRLLHGAAQKECGHAIERHDQTIIYFSR